MCKDLTNIILQHRAIQNLFRTSAMSATIFENIFEYIFDVFGLTTDHIVSNLHVVTCTLPSSILSAFGDWFLATKMKC